MPRPGDVVAHWHHFVEDFNTSSLEFYSALEATLLVKQAPVRPQRIDWAEGGILSAKREYLRATYGRYSFDIAAFPFGRDFFFSWWLTKRRPESALVLGCGAMIALLVVLVVFLKLAGYIIGFVLFAVATGATYAALANGAIAGGDMLDDIMLALPIFGSLYARFVRPSTYFSEDSRLIFQESVHAIVVGHVTALLAEKGARALAPEAVAPQSRPLLL
jgi:hypothetical protein